MRIAWTASVGLVLLSIGCGSADGGETTEPVGTSTGRIVDGFRDETDYAAVGLAVNFFNQFFGHCSGTLISPNVVLTARHCVSLTNGEAPGGSVVCGQTNFGLTGPGQIFRITTLTDRPNQDSADFYKGTGTVVVPQNSTDICGNDVALIQLEGAGIPETVTKPIIPRIDSRPEQGEEYSAIGYGLTDPNNQASSGTRMRVDGKIVYCLGGLCSGFGSENVKETEWAGEGGTCQGDSGGPAVDGKGRVMGVLSRGAGACGSSVYGDVSAWKDMITDTVKKAAAEGGIEPPFWAETGSSTPPVEPTGGSGGGGNGSEGAKCSQTEPCGGSFKCYADDGINGTCVSPCVDSSSCGSGKTCDGALKVCLANTQTKGSSGDSGGCSAAGPVKPVPWLVGVALGAFGILFARRRKR